MKVLHVTPSYVPAYRYGGAVSAVHGLCKSLIVKGVDVTVYTTTVDGAHDLDVAPGKEVYVDGVKVRYFAPGFPRKYYRSRTLSGALKQNVKKFDIVHIHSVFLYPTLVAAYWCRKYGVPYLIRPFGMIDPDMIRLRSRIKKRLYIALAEKKNLTAAAVIHLTSREEKRKFLSVLGGLERSIVVVANGVDEGDFRGTEGGVSLTDRHPQLRGKKIILFLSRLHYKKGLDLLVPAMKEIVRRREDVRLVIVGPDEGEYGNVIKERFFEAALGRYVVFTGQLTGADKAAAFRDSSVFVLPSYGENFGIVALEAMASGVPVVLSEKVALSTQVIESGAGDVTKCDPGQIAEAVLNLLDDPAAARAKGERGAALVHEHFSWEVISGHMLSLYETILERKI